MSSPNALKRKASAAGIENVPTLAAQAVSRHTIAGVPPAKKLYVDIAVASPLAAPQTNANVIVDPPQVTVAKPPRKKPVLPKLTVPCPPWRPLRGHFDRELVEQRVSLREFVHRFRDQLAVAKTHLDALDTVEPITEPTCKALLIGLLSVVHRDESDPPSKRKLGQALARLRSGKINLDDMWSIIQDVHDCFTVPLAAPTSKDMLDDSMLQRRMTRAGPHDVIHPNQLIPVLVSLSHEAVRTAVIRQELDDGVKRSAQLNQARIADTKEETDRWNKERTQLQELKKTDPAGANEKLRKGRETHKFALTRIRVKNNVELQAATLRFAPLGTDDEGRTYYALSHPAPTNTKSKGRQSVTKPRAQGNWAYFVFVWGTEPPEAPRSSDGEDEVMANDDDGDGDDIERWWAFTEASTIRDLSKWLLDKAAAKDDAMNASAAAPEPTPSNTSESMAVVDAAPTPASKPKTPAADAVKPLCKGLNDFADFLDVRFG